METLHVQPAAADGEPAASGGASRHEAAKMAAADTSEAAKKILDKYIRRPRF
jgi:hypothetical protein